MKKTIVTFLLLTLILTLTGCKFIEEQQAEGIIEDYYQAIIDENYEKAFKQLHLYDYDAETEESKLAQGTTLSGEEAKEFYLKKVAVLKKQNYKLKDFEIGEVEYADGHTFWHHINLKVELNGQEFEWTETAELYKEKLLIGGRDDKYLKFRDGKMNFNLAKEEKDISCNPPETEKGDFIIDKRINYKNLQILVANDIVRDVVDSKPLIEFIKEEADLMWYTLEDKNLYEALTIGEKVIVKMETFKEDGKNVGFIYQSYPPQANASKVIRCDK